MDIFKVDEDATSYTLGWNKPTGEDAGYRFKEEGLQKVPHTWNVERKQVRVEKGHDSYTVEALAVVDSGNWRPASQFGSGTFGTMVL